MNCTAWHSSTIHDLPGTHSIHNLCKTVWTICMSENAIVRHRPMCFPVRSSRNPTLMIEGISGFVSNECAHTTDGEQRRLFSRSGRRLMNYLSEHGFTNHSPPPSIIFHRASREQQQVEMPTLMIKHPAPAQSFMVLGNPLALRVAESSWGRMMMPEFSASAIPDSLPPCFTCQKKGSRPRRVRSTDHCLNDHAFRHFEVPIF